MDHNLIDPMVVSSAYCPDYAISIKPWKTSKDLTIKTWVQKVWSIMKLSKFSELVQIRDDLI